jgi:signal transduction histidine kinase
MAPTTASGAQRARKQLRTRQFSACLLVLGAAVICAALVVLTVPRATAGGALAVCLASGLIIAIPLAKWSAEDRAAEMDEALRLADAIGGRDDPTHGDALVQLVDRLRRFRARLAEQQAALQSATAAVEQERAARGQFLAAMNHELRTPLNAILGFAQVLDMQPLTRDQHDCLRPILKSGKHLLQLVNELMQMSQIESDRLELSLEPIDVPRLSPTSQM